jgi:hypothetical protein
MWFHLSALLAGLAVSSAFHSHRARADDPGDAPSVITIKKGDPNPVGNDQDIPAEMPYCRCVQPLPQHGTHGEPDDKRLALTTDETLTQDICNHKYGSEKEAKFRIYGGGGLLNGAVSFFFFFSFFYSPIVTMSRPFLSRNGLLIDSLPQCFTDYFNNATKFSLEWSAYCSAGDKCKYQGYCINAGEIDESGHFLSMLCDCKGNCRATME